MKKILITLLVIVPIFGLSTSVSARVHHFIPVTPTPTISATPTVTPTPHTHVCVGPDGSYTADNSVACMHQCTLADGTSYFAADGLSCPSLTITPSPTVDLGQMPTPHTHICTLSDGTTYTADNSVDCPNL